MREVTCARGFPRGRSRNDSLDHSSSSRRERRQRARAPRLTRPHYQEPRQPFKIPDVQLILMPVRIPATHCKLGAQLSPILWPSAVGANIVTPLTTALCGFFGAGQSRRAGRLTFPDQAGTSSPSSRRTGSPQRSGRCPSRRRCRSRPQRTCPSAGSRCHRRAPWGPSSFR